MKNTSSPTPPWTVITIEMFERFAWYGIYFGFGIYLHSLGYSFGQLGIVQSIFLLLSYGLPLITVSFAEQYGFKNVLIVSYSVYLSSILLLTVTRSFSAVALTMMSIGFAAGIFRPFLSGTARAAGDNTNKTAAPGFYFTAANIGASFGPLAAGKLRAVSWDYAFYAAAVSVALMLLVTLFFYKEPGRDTIDIKKNAPGKNLKVIFSAFSDLQFSVSLVLLGLFFWLPFWAFFNIIAVYVDNSLDTARLYLDIKSIFGTGIADFFSQADASGVRRVLAETLFHIGYILVILRLFIYRKVTSFPGISVFLSGLATAAAGFFFLGFSTPSASSRAFLGIFIFALGVFISLPAIQAPVTSAKPKEKEILNKGTNVLAAGLGGLLSGLYTALYGILDDAGQPGYVWFVLTAHLIIGVIAFLVFTKSAEKYNATASLSHFLERTKAFVQDDVEIVPYNPEWPQMFQKEKQYLLDCLPNEPIKQILHYGSTAIPGLSAKPIIDILMEVTSLEQTKQAILPVLEAHGYDCFWKPIPEVDYEKYYPLIIKRDSNGHRSHHIHILESDFPQWNRLVFQDYLLEFPEVAKEYEILKRELVRKYAKDRQAYSKGKEELIDSIILKAREYYKNKKSSE